MLLLLPNTLGAVEDINEVLPAAVAEAVGQLDGLFAETPKLGRQFLQRFELKKPIQDIPVLPLDKRTSGREVEEMLEPLKEGETWAILSDAGMPCIADPGAKVVARARRLGVEIRAIPGPVSMMQALVLSGLPAQQFAFHGYLRKKDDELRAQLKGLEKRSEKERATQIFMEPAHKNMRLWRLLLKFLDGYTLLGHATDLTLPTEQVEVRRVEEWRKLDEPDLHKRPSVFLLFRRPKQA